MLRPLGILGVLLFACGPASEGDDATTATGGTSATTTTGDMPTSSTPTTDESTTGSTSLTGATTLDTTTGGGDTSTSETTESPALCGPPCDAPVVLAGDVELGPDFDPGQLDCVVEIGGSLKIESLPGQLPPQLANLRRVGKLLLINDSDELTSLAGLECLEQVGQLHFFSDPKLADLSALANIEAVGELFIVESPLVADVSLFDGVAGLRVLSLDSIPAVKALPVPGPGSALEVLRIDDCDGLTNLDALAGVSGGKDSVEIEIVDSAGIVSIVGIAGLWGANQPRVLLRSLPALSSLAGLSGAEGAQLSLRDLPAVPNLEPLAGITELGSLVLDDLPKITTLAPLSDLRFVHTLGIGSCSKNSGKGLDGLTQITGLEALEELHSLNIARNDELTALPSLAGLKSPILGVTIVENAALGQANADAFIAVHGGCVQPPGTCACEEDQPRP